MQLRKAGRKKNVGFLHCSLRSRFETRPTKTSEPDLQNCNFTTISIVIGSSGSLYRRRPIIMLVIYLKFIVFFQNVSRPIFLRKNFAAIYKPAMACEKRREFGAPFFSSVRTHYGGIIMLHCTLHRFRIGFVFFAPCGTIV